MRTHCKMLFPLVLALLPTHALGASLPGELERRFAAPYHEPQAALHKPSAAALETFYATRGWRPLWVAERGVTPKGEALVAALADAHLDGLVPEQYDLAAIRPLLGARDTERLAALELRLSRAYLSLVEDLGEGLLPPEVGEAEKLAPRQPVDLAAALRRAAYTADVAALVASYRPASEPYQRLRGALAVHRSIAVEGGWSRIPEGTSLKEGMHDPRTPLLRERLRLWGDVPAAPTAAPEAFGDPTLYDAQLASGVRRMQERHGLEPDGVVGPRTLAVLNVPVERRIAQILANLERLRWMPDALGRRHILVNQAAFTLDFFEDGESIRNMRVVVGKPKHRTPIFSDEMTYLVVNPYWNVPRSIARNELLPKIKQDVSYLVNNDYQMLSGWGNDAAVIDPWSVDWSQVSRNSFGYRIRQNPGGGNALGRIKFMLPNRHNIYLHDTPAKSLFNRASRAYSHGCIRLHDPMGMAQTVLETTPGWSRARVEQTIASGQRRIVSLAEPIPVHITYITSWVDPDGTIHFRDDIYGRDASIIRALEKVRATAPVS